MERSPVLRLNSITRRFGGLCALNGVSFVVPEGQIKGLIGPNGAGKTTLFNIISGVLSPSEGSVVFLEKDVTAWPSHERCYAGMGRVFQISQLFWDATVLDNVRTGHDWRSGYSLLAAGLRLGNVSRMEKAGYLKSMEILQRMGLSGKADVTARNLSLGEQRLLEISRALATGPKLLLLDEPTAGLNSAETLVLLKAVRQIRDSGITILVIEHNMKLIMDVSDEIVVLNFGEKIAEGDPGAIQQNEAVIAAYLGERIC